MVTMTDSEIVARLIFRAYVSPGYAPASMSDKDALVPFQAALDLHARLRLRDQETQEILAAADALPLARFSRRGHEKTARSGQA